MRERAARRSLALILVSILLSACGKPAPISAGSHASALEADQEMRSSETDESDSDDSSDQIDDQDSDQGQKQGAEQPNQYQVQTSPNTTFTLTALSPSSKKGKPVTKTCLDEALRFLRANSPSGYQAYNLARNKSVFEYFLGDCTQSEFYEFDIPTAVHESTHAIHAETNSYLLLSGEMLKTPSIQGFFAPGEMANTMTHYLNNDDLYDIYLSPGSKASSRESLIYLLDELNAYTVDLEVSIDSVPRVQLKNRQIGVPAFLSFLAFYATYARARHPDVFNRMSTDPTMKSVITKLWNQAEQTLLKSCKLRSEPASDESRYIQLLCDPGQTSAISSVIDRPVKCPSACH